MAVMRSYFYNLIDIELSLRARADQTHVAFKYIEKLWNFIHSGFSHKPANGSNSRIVLAAKLRSFLFSIYVHRPEFVDVKWAVVLTNALLLEKHRSGR